MDQVSAESFVRETVHAESLALQAIVAEIYRRYPRSSEIRLIHYLISMVVDATHDPEDEPLA